MFPIWVIDFTGSAVMIFLSILCLSIVRRLFLRDPESPLVSYLLWLTGAIAAFAVSRSIGHIVKHILYFSDKASLWESLRPISGSINSITFVIIASVTLFFNRIQAIMNRMSRDRIKIEKSSQELLELNRKIEDIVFERTRSEMALRVAHEVRNPVMIIGGLVQLLIKKSSSQCLPEKKHLERILEQSGKLEDLVAHFEEIKPEMKKIFTSLDLNQLIEESLDVLQPEIARKGITLLLDRSSILLIFQGNEQLLKIAIMHILRNAIEACSAGDTLQVTTELSGQGIIGRFQDNGPGIPQEILSHIFKPFFSTGEGETGLGLPYVKQIITEHKGEVFVTSTAGQGTTVEIVLPTHLGELNRPLTH